MIPNYLLSRDIWACHRAKVPFDPKTGRFADCRDAATWSSYRTAEAARWKYGYDGLAIALGNGLCGVDLDRVFDYKLAPEARSIVERLNSYSEFSFSSSGIHILVVGEIPASRRKQSIEMYGSARFFAFTGRRFGMPFDVERRQVELSALYAELFPPQQWTQYATPHNGNARTDEQVLEAGRRDTLFTMLYFDGDLTNYSGDWSGADLALTNKLRVLTHGNREQMDRLFRSSALFRAKWDRQHGEMTYGERTLAVALGLRYNHNFRRAPRAA